MPTTAYIILQDSSGSGGYYAVVMGGYTPTSQREQAVNRTVGGTLDISQGANYEVHRYLIRCRESEPRPSYGDFAELKRLWELNNPKATPSDRITFTDHFGVARYAYFQGEFPWQAVTTILQGEDAWYFIPVTLMLEPT